MKRHFFEEAAKITQRNMAGGAWVKQQFGDSILEAKTTVKPGTITVQPEAEANVTARVPMGAAATPVNAVKSISPFQSITIHVDARQVNNGRGSGFTRVNLFDVYGDFRAKNGLPETVVGGPVIYMGSSTNNRYKNFLSRVCSRNYYFYGMTVKVNVAEAADFNNADIQFGQELEVHRVGLRESHSYTVALSEFINPFQQDASTRAIPLTGEYALIDGETTWSLNVLDGCEVVMTMYLSMETR